MLRYAHVLNGILISERSSPGHKGIVTAVGWCAIFWEVVTSIRGGSSLPAAFAMIEACKTCDLMQLICAFNDKPWKCPDCGTTLELRRYSKWDVINASPAPRPMETAAKP